MNIDKINVGGNLYDVCDTNARAMISDEYNSATQYSAGDYCIWENTLKKANKSTTGTYDHTAWDDTNIGEVVGELNQNMNSLESDINLNESMDITSGTILDWANTHPAGCTAMGTRNYIPADNPNESNEFSLLIVGHEGRKVVIAYLFGATPQMFAMRSIFNSNWYSDWYSK